MEFMSVFLPVAWHQTLKTIDKYFYNPIKLVGQFTFLVILAQAGSSRLVTEEFRVRSQASPCRIFGGQAVNGTRSSPRTSGFPCQYVTSPRYS